MCSSVAVSLCVSVLVGVRLRLPVGVSVEHGIAEVIRDAPGGGFAGDFETLLGEAQIAAGAAQWWKGFAIKLPFR